MDTKVADPLHGALLGGRYRIMGRLARGGMATVYQARDERLERVVAVKIIHPDGARDPRFLERLTEEAKTVARLAHPNVVAVYDQGSHDGAPYIVMEYVRGRTLREVLIDRGRVDPAEALAILEQVLAALAIAHRSGLVHRDVKPENILVAPPPNGSGDLVDAVVKVADFGLAHAVEIASRRGGQLLATAEYVAPELVADGRADPRADIYSAGIVLFEMLTGRVPFQGDRPEEVAWHHVEHDVPPPSRLLPGLPRMLDEVVTRATRRDPGERPRDAAAMLGLVQTAREDVGALTGPTRALAHPTVIVPSVGSDSRPSWARLPGPRRGWPPPRPPAGPGQGRPASGARGTMAAAGRQLQGALGTVRSRIGGIRSTSDGRRKLIAAIIAAVLVVSVGTWWFGFGRYVEAPALVQLTRDNAVSEATRLGFTVVFGRGEYQEAIPADTVLRQDPDAGGRILPGGTLTLVLSLGPERFQVPDVSGQAADFATEKLKEQFVVTTGDGYSDNLPVGYVVGTDPQAGTQVKRGSEVKLIIAKGPYPVHVPTVVGKVKAEVEGQLTSMGFQIEVQTREDQTKPKDFILEQNPQGGQGLVSAKGQKIVLIVATGPPGTPMPSLLGARCADAINVMHAQGYQVNANGNPIEQQFFFTVKAQNPQPGEPIAPGGTINLQCDR